ncbi:MAG: ABC transporter permease subunit, partial [Candidatus Aminicenantes bacterium]|nr:ABC transporter permease subunit [Candidatus Aminicenantes bacterium]
MGAQPKTLTRWPPACAAAAPGRSGAGRPPGPSPAIRPARGNPAGRSRRAGDRTRALSLVEQSSARIRENEKEKIRHAAERQKTHQAVSLYRQEVEVLERDNDSLRVKLGSLADRIATLEEDYVTVARARGLPDSRIMTSYVGRNAMLPLFTQLAISVGFVVGGSVLIENIFVY